RVSVARVPDGAKERGGVLSARPRAFASAQLGTADGSLRRRRAAPNRSRGGANARAFRSRPQSRDRDDGAAQREYCTGAAGGGVTPSPQASTPRHEGRNLNSRAREIAY